MSHPEAILEPMTETQWTLDRQPPIPTSAPTLDSDQQSVVDHRRGPLLVLAGPGTGKTTTIVESVVARLTDSSDPLTPDQILVLTFGRRAAAELRTRIALRAGVGPLPTVATFHAFAYGLMRQQAALDEFVAPPRLLSGPEQQTRIRELLLGGLVEQISPWPPEFAEAIRTRGFAEQVRTLIATMRSQGIDGADLCNFGERAGLPAWQAAGLFADEYLNVNDGQGVLDYTEVLLRAALAAERDRSLRSRYRAIYVDEFQDTDPLQIRLLQALATVDTALVAVGDPDQAIYSFRGADVRGLLRFGEQFPAAEGDVPVIVLRTTRRFGPAIRNAATRVIGAPLPLGPHLDAVRLLREPRCDPSAPAGRVEAVVFDDARLEAEYVADRLRRAALDADNPVPWSDMAVLVRSGTLQIPVLRRALIAAGVPVEVAGDEVPLAREPAVAPLLMAAEVVAAPRRLTAELAESILTSPLAGIDPADLRALIRHLRRRQRDALAAESAFTGEAAALPASTAEITVDLVRDPSVADDVPPGPLSETARAVQRLATLIRAARHDLEAKASPAEVLWTLWSGTSWPRRLERRALRGGAAARRAHADLDAVIALFDEAERAADRGGGVAGLDDFVQNLQAQEIPASATIESAVGRDAVRLLTAHRAKGLEWSFVVVVGVQEDVWPDVRPRGSLLAANTLGADSTGQPELIEPASTAALLAEERRLFYVACTRARSNLLVTAVASPDDERGAQPSRFLADLGVPVVQRGSSAAATAESHPRALTLPAVVADLRRTVLDPTAPLHLKAAAADRLALLADLRLPDQSPVVSSADPATWWYSRGTTDPGVPMHAADSEVWLSGSSVSTITQCALRWFLDHEARAATPRGTAAGFGTLVHAIAELVASEQVAPDVEALDELLGRVWSELGFEAPWHSAAQRSEARTQLSRLLVWHEARESVLLGAEVPFTTRVSVSTPTGDVAVALTGVMDVIEVQVGDGVDEPTRVHVADLKTGAALTAAAVADHPQLAIYQLAVDAGAVNDALTDAGIDPQSAVADGASIVALRSPHSAGSLAPKVQRQQPFAADEPPWILEPLAHAAEVLRAERFWATPCSLCDSCSYRSLCPAQPEGKEVLGR